jgi:bifunctional ADP-heptose synthase (sugar kinase/adenylyltransferase)
VAALQARAAEAEAKLASSAVADPSEAPRKKVRIYLDGCFDMMHFGHRSVVVFIANFVIVLAVTPRRMFPLCAATR